MSRLTHSQLQRQIEILLANGQLELAQSVIASIGYNQAGLDTGQALLETWLNGKIKAQALLAAQKQATLAQEQALQAARDEVGSLRNTVRVLYGDNPTVLTSLGLLPRRSNGVESVSSDNGAEPTNGNGHSRSRTSSSLAETVAGWRLTIANISTLTETQQAELANAGWSSERISTASAMVEACATADNVQQQKIQAYRAACAAAREAETAVRKWYSQAARLSRSAIKQADPANREQLRQLLGV